MAQCIPRWIQTLNDDTTETLGKELWIWRLDSRSYVHAEDA